MVYNQARQATFVFAGGYSIDDTTDRYFRNDTWELRNGVWSERVSLVKPSSRWKHAMAYGDAETLVPALLVYESLLRATAARKTFWCKTR